MTLIVNIVTCLVLMGSLNEAAKILAVFPIPSISHQVVFRPVLHELARRGHEVTVITPDPAFPKGGTPQNLTEINVHDISYKIWKDLFMSSTKGNKDDVIMIMDVILKVLTLIVDAQLKDEQVHTLIRDKYKQFDLLFLEACVRPILAFSHIYKVPVIQMSSFGAALDNYATVGAPVHPFLYPAVTRQRIYNLTLWEKVTELLLHYRTDKLYEDSKVSEDTMLRKHFGSDIPTVSELNNNVDMLFLNVHPVFEGIRPVPPSVVYMGGLHQKPDQDLPPDLKSYLDSSENGVIYVSFGTNVDPTSFPADRIEVLVKTFAELPYDVLWKWNNNKLPGRSKNIRISKWLPQQDLLTEKHPLFNTDRPSIAMATDSYLQFVLKFLKYLEEKFATNNRPDNFDPILFTEHPKIKVFITQAGLQSTDEAITAGVPLIGLPMFGDQWYNAEKYEYHKIGIKLVMEKLTVEQFKRTIRTVIEDERYRRNIVNLRNVMHDEPMRPLERAVWWTEHVLRHGGAKHLRSPAANISWAQYLELELVLCILVVFLSALAMFIAMCWLLYKVLFGNNVTSKKIKRS